MGLSERPLSIYSNSICSISGVGYDFEMRNGLWLTSLFLVVLLSAPAAAKERHLEQLRVLLMVRAAKCVTCHESPDGKKLNLYGQRLAILPIALTWSDRIAALESDKPRDRSKDRVLPPGMVDESATNSDQDVDGDGVPNWVEILAGTNPGKKNDFPGKKETSHITEVVSCKICHTATGLPGDGLKANPHNELGMLLARTIPKRHASKPNSDAAIHLAAERTSILKRFELIKAKRPKRSRATFWEKIRLIHAPADADDNPKQDELQLFRKTCRAQKRRKTRDVSLGFENSRHKLDGFLLDAKSLD